MNTLRRMAVGASLLGVYEIGALAGAPTLYEGHTISQHANVLAESTDLRLRQVQQTIAAAVNTRLVVLEGSEDYNCPIPEGLRLAGGHVNSYSTFAPFYCFTRDTIVVSAGSYNEIRHDITNGQPGLGQALDEFVVAHENGHAIQKREGADIAFKNVRGVVNFELQADCEAGALLHDIGSTKISSIEGMLRSWPLDINHGTGEQRADAFAQGARGGNC